MVLNCQKQRYFKKRNGVKSVIHMENNHDEEQNELAQKSRKSRKSECKCPPDIVPPLTPLPPDMPPEDNYGTVWNSVRFKLNRQFCLAATSD